MRGVTNPVCTRCNQVGLTQSDSLECICPNRCGAILTSIYPHIHFQPDTSKHGLARYQAWLPPSKKKLPPIGSITYKSLALGKYFGLDHLYISFNGYWPEKNAWMESMTFKELEAWAVCATYRPSHGRLSLASAGNAARSFLWVGYQQQIPLDIYIPDYAEKTLLPWFPTPDWIRLYVVPNKSYNEVIHLQKEAIRNSHEKITAIGGYRNTARRDAIGTLFYNACEVIGQTPDHYFQAVGSGAGAIAIREANQRITLDGSFGQKDTCLHLSQSGLCSVMVDAWIQGTRTLVSKKSDTYSQSAKTMLAKVLGNLEPGYGISGGVFDKLKETRGYLYSVDESKAPQWQKFFEEKEGCDIGLPSAIAIDSLNQAVSLGRLGKSDIVLLNISEGGHEKLKGEKKVSS